MHDPPDPHVGLADQAGQLRDRHLPDHRHHQRLEQQREPRALPRPRHRHQPHVVLRAANPRHPRGEIRLMLEEVQMPPRLLLSVVRLEPTPVALRAANVDPFGKSTRRSSRLAPASNSTLVTCHGALNPSAAWKRRRSCACIRGSHRRRSEAGQAISPVGRYPPSSWRSHLDSHPERARLRSSALVRGRLQVTFRCHEPAHGSLAPDQRPFTLASRSHTSVWAPIHRIRSEAPSGIPSGGCSPRSSRAADCQPFRSPSIRRHSAESCRCRSPP
jgi:hypothetical protein